MRVNKIRLLLVMALIIAAGQRLFSQQMLQPRRVVDSHTAGMLPRASDDFDCRYYPSSNPDLGAGINAGLAVGISDRLMIGIGYGGEGLIGRGRKVQFNYFPGLLFKYRLFEARFAGPGVAIGYDHQGFGGLSDTSEFDYKGYIYQSPGFFLALSKNFKLLNHVLFGIHTTVNFSMEDVRHVKWPNLFTGIDISLNEELALVFEYNFGFNTRDFHGQDPVNYALINEGYLNAGLRWAFTPQFFIEFDAKDVLENRYKKTGRPVGWTRELKLVYFFSFLKDQI
jgi:hypothetical protein